MLTDSEIRARRAVNKLTQEEFAEKLKISREYLNRIETGKIRTVSEKIERQYDDLFKGKRLLNVSSSRGVSCPYCESEQGSFRVYADPSNNTLNDVYECRDCKQTFAVHVTWRMTKTAPEANSKQP